MSTDAPAGLADLIAFLDASPSPWHAVESMIERLTGFERLDERDAWSDVPSAGFVVRDAALIAWRLPAGATDASLPFRIVGGHTDSPCLRVKPHPDAGGFGWKQLAVEVYGGILNNSWLDRDLGVAGSAHHRRRRGHAGERPRAGGPRPATRRAPRSGSELGRVAPRHAAAPEPGVGCRVPGGRRLRRAGSATAPGSPGCRRGGSCRSTTCRVRRCSVRMGRCCRPGDSTTSSRAGPP